MFANKSSAGKHLVLDCRDISNAEVLRNPEAMLNLMDVVCETVGLTVLNKNHHRFCTGDITAVYMLTESHISLHTFSERNHMCFDLFTCKEIDESVLHDVAGFIITILGAGIRSDFRIIDRVF